MSTPQPLHSDRPKSTALQMFSPVIAALLIVMGIASGDAIPLFMGLGLGVFMWFTRQVLYEIFTDRLVIHFGKPRQQIVLLSEITDVQLVKIPMGGRGLYIKTKRGRGCLIRPGDPDLLQAQLNATIKALPQPSN